MGTAPRRPTHEMKSFVRVISLNGDRVRNMLRGLATKIRKAEMSRPIPITGTI